MAHEEALERRDPLDHAEAELAHEAQRQKVVGEQPVEAVGDRDQRQRIEPPPALVARQHLGAAGIEPQAPGVDHQLGQRRDVAQCEVPALAGDRVDRAGGIADQRQAPRGVALRLHHRERIVPARPGQLERAELVAEALGQLVHELRIVQADQVARQTVVRGPDDR